ncbi:MAG TPA: hypothetical protein VGE47_01345 [Burkholderiaceae bacterium]
MQIITADRAKRIQIVATGVDDFLASDVRASNIIDRLSQYGGNNDPDGEVAALFCRLMFDSEPDAAGLSQLALREKSKRYAMGFWTFEYLNRHMVRRSRSWPKLSN